jgi:hypothetical protein
VVGSPTSLSTDAGGSSDRRKPVVAGRTIPSCERRPTPDVADSFEDAAPRREEHSGESSKMSGSVPLSDVPEQFLDRNAWNEILSFAGRRQSALELLDAPNPDAPKGQMRSHQH